MFITRVPVGISADSRHNLVVVCNDGSIWLGNGRTWNQFEANFSSNPVGIVKNNHQIVVICEDGSVYSYDEQRNRWSDTIPPIPGSKTEKEEAEKKK